VAYVIQTTSRANRDLRALDPPVRDRIGARIDALADDPRPAGAKLLRGDWDGHWRIRVGDWRVIYRVEDDRLVVVVVRVGGRGGVYD